MKERNTMNNEVQFFTGENSVENHGHVVKTTSLLYASFRARKAAPDPSYERYVNLYRNEWEDGVVRFIVSCEYLKGHNKNRREEVEYSTVFEDEFSARENWIDLVRVILFDVEHACMSV